MALTRGTSSLREGVSYVGTSWKMSKSVSEALAWVEEVVDGAEPTHDVQPLVLPSAMALHAVAEYVDGRTDVWVGAQHAHQQDAGAVTGEVSMAQVKDAGAAGRDRSRRAAVSLR